MLAVKGMLLSKIKTVFALGFVSVGRALFYRLGLELGLNPVKRISYAVPQAPFFFSAADKDLKESFSQRNGNIQWNRQLSYFSSFTLSSYGVPPDWFFDPFTNQNFEHAAKPWWAIPDFIESGRDIKSIWELSRFDWVLAFSQCSVKGDAASLEKLNSWLADWCEKNPPYTGPNWKCGQEASIRVIHLLVAALLFKQTVASSKGLVELVEAHLQRIRPTLLYALAQDNNHGTSEAAALYCGGVFLSNNGLKAIGRRYKQLGLKYLNERVKKLVLPDGTFSQYSVNYHRLMLETMSFCELWARAHKETVFNEAARERMRAATVWLATLVVSENGDVPVLGANDGAHLLRMTNAGYRDYRPAVSLAAVLFGGARPFRDSNSLEHLAWFGLDAEYNDVLVELEPGDPQLRHFSDGGLVKLQSQGISVFFRYPKYAFRPGQCDAMHVDIWANSESISGDAGSFSYNAPDELGVYFSGPKGHNAIEFDDRAAMPKMSRFLYAEWLKPINVVCQQTANSVQAKAEYVDWKGARHIRSLVLDFKQNKKRLTVTDTCSGYSEQAVLRWRLFDGCWQINDHSIACEQVSFSITANMDFDLFELVDGWQSLYYMQKQQIPVLEVTFKSKAPSNAPLVITTEVLFH